MNTRKKYDEESSFKKRVILVEANPKLRANLSSLIFTRLFLRVTVAENFTEALEILLSAPEEVSYVILDDLAAQAMTERALIEIVKDHPEIKAKFILFAELTSPHWPGQFIQWVEKSNISTLMSTMSAGY
ncbi:MAG: hypothetical protein ACXVA9_08525 [Bdellovibrionales bacterium]